MHCTHFACLFIHFSNTIFCQNHVSSRSTNKAQICNILHSHSPICIKRVLYIIATVSSTTDRQKDMCLYFVYVLPSLKLSFHLSTSALLTDSPLLALSNSSLVSDGVFPRLTTCVNENPLFLFCLRLHYALSKYDSLGACI